MLLRVQSDDKRWNIDQLAANAEKIRIRHHCLEKSRVARRGEWQKGAAFHTVRYKCLTVSRIKPVYTWTMRVIMWLNEGKKITGIKDYCNDTYAGLLQLNCLRLEPQKRCLPPEHIELHKSTWTILSSYGHWPLILRHGSTWKRVRAPRWTAKDLSLCWP